MPEERLYTMASAGEDALAQLRQLPSPIENAFIAIREQITRFESRLSRDEETVVLLVSFGPTVVIRVSNISFVPPQLMVLRGTDEVEGREVELLQHISQTNILLKRVPKKGKEARRIGF